MVDEQKKREWMKWFDNEFVWWRDGAKIWNWQKIVFVYYKSVKGINKEGQKYII